MSNENRTVTVLPWGSYEDATATPAELTCPRYTDMNGWQDGGVRIMSSDGTMSPAAVGFEDIEGGLRFYCQTAEIATASALNLTLTNPYGYDTQFDCRTRIIECTAWAENTAAELPGGGLYDPDTYVHSPIWHLWYTEDGAADGAPPTGFYWQPWANIYFYAHTTSPYSLRCYNNSGASIFVVIQGTITDQIA